MGHLNKIMIYIPLNSQKKLKERYGDSIFVAEIPDLSITVCFKDMVIDILNDK